RMRYPHGMGSPQVNALPPHSTQHNIPLTTYATDLQIPRPHQQHDSHDTHDHFRSAIGTAWRAVRSAERVRRARRTRSADRTARHAVPMADRKWSWVSWESCCSWVRGILRSVAYVVKRMLC